MDTIVALATPPGRSAIGLVRLSGPSVREILRALVADQIDFAAAHPLLRNIVDPRTGDLLDRSIVTYFAAPRSFTGEDVLEISCHGSPLILRRLIDAAIYLGARLADPGEFTLRALGNGKMNLSQAEAIRDLINARSDAALRQAFRQMNGELARRLQPFKDQLVALIVRFESAIEFVEDDLPQVETNRVVKALQTLIADISSLAATFDAGHLVRDGVKVTVTGSPNAGKSSIFNRLLGLDRSIVTAVPGTTRDTLSETTTIGGMPVTFTDTAGIRETKDEIERLGVSRTERAMGDADLLLVVIDGSIEIQPDDLELLRKTEDRRRVLALNKSDLAEFSNHLTDRVNGHSPTVVVSAKTGAGVDQLQQEIVSQFASLDEHEGLLITDARHYDLLSRTRDELESTARLIKSGTGEEIVLTGLHNALRLLDEITGETTTEDILTQIFLTFCIGK